MGPVDGRTVELLMRSADLALYRSKDQGGNTHHSYQHKLHANAEEKRLMEFELRATRLSASNCMSNISRWSMPQGDNMLVGFEALAPLEQSRNLGMFPPPSSYPSPRMQD